MTSQPHFAQPPSVAVWLISLFAGGEEAESILGDLEEEFLLIASQSGVSASGGAAQRWYWRQAIRTVPRLAGLSFRAAPWTTAATVAGGFLLRKLVAPLIDPVTFGVLERYPGFLEYHFSAYRFFASTGLDIEHLMTFLLIGFVVALAAKQREMVATGMLALIFGAMALVGSVYAAIQTGNDAFLWRLTWYFADSFAVVAAGVMVRTHRLAVRSRTSAVS